MWKDDYYNAVIDLGRFNIPKTVRYIKNFSKITAKHPKIVELASQLEDHPEREKAIFDYLYDNIVYRADDEGFQQIRFGDRALRDGVGNCVDYTVLLSAVLRNWKVPHKLRVVSYGRPSAKEHIYVVTDKGVVMDAVIGQRQDDSDTKYNRPPASFNEELPYTSKYDYYIPSK